MQEKSSETWTPVTHADWASHEATKPYDEPAERAQLTANGQRFIDGRLEMRGPTGELAWPFMKDLDPLRVGMWLRMRSIDGAFTIEWHELEACIKDGAPVPRPCTCETCWHAHKRARDAKLMAVFFDQKEIDADRELLRSLLLDKAGLNRMLAFRDVTDSAYKPLSTKLGEVERKITNLERAASARGFLKMREDVWLT